MQVRSRITRLLSDLQVAQGNLLTNREVNELTETLRQLINELPQLQLQPGGVSHAYRLATQSVTAFGRPRFMVNQEQLHLFMYNRFSIRDIAETLHISARTVSRRLRLFGIQIEQYSQCTNEELDEHVRAVVGFNRLIGPNTVMVQLRNNGIRLQRERVRQAMRRVDPAGFSIRTMQRIQRRSYKVAGPNSLWHLDGNHKLITWRLVVHRGIDGDTRLVAFVDVAANNRAATVFSGFMRGIVDYCVPSRVRCDLGGENNLVERFMETYRGLNRGSVIRGSSVHNQRIERLWNDVWRGTVNCYYDLFSFMERQGILIADNDEHIYALHYVFIPRIKQGCENFRAYWNNHGIRTARFKTPNQMFISRALQMFGSTHTAIRDLFAIHRPEAQVHANELFADEAHREEPIDNHRNIVLIPPVPQLLNAVELAVLQDRVDPLDQSGDVYGIAIYLKTLLVMAELLHARQ